MTSLDSSSLSFWEIVAKIGFVVVIVGVVIEGAEILVKLTRSGGFKKWIPYSIQPKLVKISKFIDEKMLWFESIGFSILVIGLSVEFLGDFVAMRIADYENARLNKKASDAEERSNKALKDAAFANERSGMLELTNAILRASVATLEKENITIKTNILKIDPWKQSIVFGYATARLTATGANPEAVQRFSLGSTVFGAADIRIGTDTQLMTNRPAMHLIADKIEAAPSREGPAMYSMIFHMASIPSIDASRVEDSENWDTVYLSIPPFFADDKNEIDIEGGSVLVLVNGFMAKEFEIPKQTARFGPVVGRLKR